MIIEPGTAQKQPIRRVTMAAVGRIAGVSQVTVSRALSDPSKVSPDTLKNIRDAIEATGFVPNAVAGALASQKSQLISALVPSLTNIVYSSTVQSFSEAMKSTGYQVLTSETGFSAQEEEATIRSHLSRRPDAILLTGIHHTPKARQMLLGAGIPIVEVWDITETPIDLCVGFSHRGAGIAAADFALQTGYTRAATISAGDERALRRRSSFVSQFESHASSKVVQVNFEAQASLANGRAGLKRLIETERFEKGLVFCSSDILAHGVIIEAAARKLSVPEEIAVIGFGDQDFAAHTEPGLTTVSVNRDELGRAAAASLLKRFEDDSDVKAVVDVGYSIKQRGSA